MPARLALRTILALTLLSTVLTIPVRAEDQHPYLQRKLDAFCRLTTFSSDGAEIVQEGSVLILHKDGLRMTGFMARVPITNVYKDDRIAASTGKWSMATAIVQSDTPIISIPQRTFDSGEKFWVSSMQATKSGIVLIVVSDPYSEIRYYAHLEIPYGKKGGASDDELMKELARVVTVDLGPVETATAAIPAPGSAEAVSAAADLTDPKELINNKLRGTFVLAEGNIDEGEIDSAGSIIELRKEGLVMWPTSAKVAPTYIYRDGKLSMPFMLKAELNADLTAKTPELNVYNVAKRPFQPGEKFWITGYKVTEKGVTLSFASDAYGDVRYWGEILFQFDKKRPVPPPEAITSLMAEVINVQPPPAEN